MSSLGIKIELAWLVIVANLIGVPFSVAQIKSNLASSITSASVAPVWVARDRGLFRKYGLDMQYVLVPRSPLAVAALIAGEIDLAIMGPGHLLNAAIGGADLVGIANFYQKLNYQFVGRPEIKRAEDLRGKRVAMTAPGGVSHIVALLALQRLGIDPNQAKITLLTIPGTEMNRRIALETGNVDASPLDGSVGDLYASRGYTILFNFKGSGVTMPQTALVTSRRTASNKPQIVEAYLKTFIEAISYLLDPANKEHVMRILAFNLRLSKAVEAGEAYEAVTQSVERVPRPDLEGMKALHRILSSINPKLVEVRPQTVVDESFIQRIETSGFTQNLQRRP